MHGRVPSSLVFLPPEVLDFPAVPTEEEEEEEEDDDAVGEGRVSQPPVTPDLSRVNVAL